jgi:hypothetical protein
MLHMLQNGEETRPNATAKTSSDYRIDHSTAKDPILGEGIKLGVGHVSISQIYPGFPLAVHKHKTPN